MSQEMIDDFKRINDLIYAKGLALGSAEYFVVREICCKHTKTVSTEEHALKLTQIELDYCYEHAHGNTPYMKAKAYGRMIEVLVQRKYDALNKVIKCPMCDSENYIHSSHEGDGRAPECAYWVCNDCGHTSNPE